jgi:short-subunit dehydrogenase
VRSKLTVAGCRVVITGASRGLGAALATRLAYRGARLALVARSAEPLAKLAAGLGGAAYPADLADVDSIDPLVQRIASDGPVDVLVNNAGIDLAGSLTELAPDRIQELITVNLVAPILLCRAVIPLMRRAGGGHLVNVSSIAGTNAVPGLGPYSSSKAGLSHFTASLRAELKGTPITTTLAEIGPVTSTMMESLRGHEPTRRALARLEALHLAPALDMNRVVAALVDAIERRRRHVRLPHRDALFPVLVETPRRMTEWLLAGVEAE